ncbi:MAG TPA: hypothetical protein VFA20_02115 [Myxococcaceae bacterium]|nr:hypothetical protein [Myxococcaceae bacterium]
MRPSIVALAVVLGAGTACSASNSACFRTCPALGGQWQVTFEAATDPAECQKAGVTVSDGLLAITQQTSALTATFGAEELSGTAYDTGQFTLDGLTTPDAGNPDAFSFRGTYLPGADGGASGDSLSGLYDATLVRPSGQGPVTCRLVRNYTAARR